MAKKFLADINVNKSPYVVSSDLISEKLGEYYFLFEDNPDKLNKLISGFDQNGIPINKAYVDVENPKTHYYPISIGQYGLALFNKYIRTNDKTTREHFLRIADWFLENRIEETKLGTYWLTNVPKPEYKIESAWKSAFTQSRAISILLRAWQMTSDDKYFDAAESSLTIFSFDIKDGGVTVKSDFGNIYEEYVASEPTMVLDGHIFSLFGLFDFIRATKIDYVKSNEFAIRLFNEGINGLKKLLPKYDLGFWVRFNLCEMKHYPKIDPCTIGYLKLITLQLTVLHKITGDDVFDNYSNKFKNYLNFQNILRMLFIKYKALKKLNRL